MGGTLSASAEPGRTILRVAGQLEGLPHRFGAHPSAYTVSFYGPGALSGLPAHWVSADRPGCGRFGATRHVAVTGQPHQGGSQLAHPGAVPPNERSIGPLALDETNGEDGLLGDLAGAGSGPVLVAAWDKVSLGCTSKENVRTRILVNRLSTMPRPRRSPNHSGRMHENEQPFRHCGINVARVDRLLLE